MSVWVGIFWQDTFYECIAYVRERELSMKVTLCCFRESSFLCYLDTWSHPVPSNSEVSE